MSGPFGKEEAKLGELEATDTSQVGVGGTHSPIRRSASGSALAPTVSPNSAGQAGCNAA